MKLVLLMAIAFLVLAAFAVATLKRKTKLGPVETRKRTLMTKREQAMYWRLRQTFPDSVVLGQVAFSALITSAFAHRNRYDRKTADFVLCAPSMQVLAIIELDDASHAGKEAKDAARAALLTSAGYTVLRFANVPDVAELRAQLPIQTPDAATAAPPNARIAPPVAK